MPSPGAYHKSCREPAGVDREDVVSLLMLLRLRPTLFGHPSHFHRIAWQQLLADITAIEEDRQRADQVQLMALRLTFDFRPAEYRRICAEADAFDAAHPPLQHERTASHG